MKFCIKCKTRLDLITPPGEGNIIFQCFGCKEIYNSTAIDTLIYSHKYNQEDISWNKFIRNAAHMDDNTKIKKKCPKCPREYVKIVITGDDMRRYFVCICGYQW